MAELDTFLQLQVKLPCIGVQLGAIFGMAPKNLLLHLCPSALSDPLTNALYTPARRNFTKYDPSHRRALNWTHDCPPQRLLTAITRPQMEMRKNVPP